MEIYAELRIRHSWQEPRFRDGLTTVRRGDLIRTGAPENFQFNYPRTIAVN